MLFGFDLIVWKTKGGTKAAKNGVVVLSSTGWDEPICPVQGGIARGRPKGRWVGLTEMGNVKCAEEGNQSHWKEYPIYSENKNKQKME